MNTLFILGNGFDLNLGLKTDYPSFYDALKAIDTPPILESLKDEIFKNKENWADFELGLGEYTKKINHENDFIELYRLLINFLADYLEFQESKLNSYNFDVVKIKRELLNPISTIPLEEGKIRNEIISFRGKFKSNNITNIITFNYTNSLEKIFNSNKNIPLSNRNNVNTISHVHGDLKNRMILGVNDSDQISNESFKDKVNVTSRFIKNQVNEISGDLTFENCNSNIKNANLIILFGVSIGATDKIWWQKIYTRLKSGSCKLLIFHHHSLLFDSKIPYE